MINRPLFELLSHRFGGNIKVRAENEPMVASYTLRTDQTTRNGGLKYRLSPVEESGEEYMVCCPFCGDTRNRLYINHRWASYDYKTETRNLWLAHCWNEECLSGWDNQLKLFKLVHGDSRVKPSDLEAQIKAGRPVNAAREVKSPGATWLLVDVIRRVPDHPAVRYLQNRLLDPLELAQRYRLLYCSESSYEQARHRLIAPILVRNQMRGWQARLLTNQKDRKDIVRWWTGPGTKKTQCLYGIDVACRYKTVVMTEGPSSTWGAGPQGFGIMGKSLDTHQVDLLKSMLLPDTLIVVMLDPVWDKTMLEKGKPHPILSAVKKLLLVEQFRGCVLPVFLPEPYDPAALSRPYLWELTEKVAKARGLHVDWSEWPEDLRLAHAAARTKPATGSVTHRPLRVTR